MHTARDLLERVRQFLLRLDEQTYEHRDESYDVLEGDDRVEALALVRDIEFLQQQEELPGLGLQDVPPPGPKSRLLRLRSEVERERANRRAGGG